MSIDLQLDKAGDTVTITVSGDIDMSSSTKMRDVLTPLFQNNNKVIVVDLSGVSYMDSSGIATLVEGLQWSHNSNNKFRLAALSPGVKDVFEIARLLTIFEVFETKEQALVG
ncbi:MAG: STAS domain-containing protein [Nitrospina sp.]|jgi:anti-sigma B factor antagonist|nr:STAS domain-containing protein [Nitrospina sp.]